MAFFERFRTNAAASPEQQALSAAADRIDEAHARIAGAERRRDYEEARVAELLPDMREQAGLEIAEQAARNKLARTRTTLGLVRDILALRPSDAQHTEELRRLEAEEQTRMIEHEAQATRLAALKSSIAERDKELRKRFGLPDQD